MTRLQHNHIAGRWVAAESGHTRTNRNPADPTDAIGDFAESGGVDVENAVAAASAAGPGWRALGPIARGEILRRAWQLLAERRADMAAAITREQGKRLGEAGGEVDRALAVLDFTIGEARRLGGVTVPAEEPRTFACTFRVPIGVVGLITPWNFPLAIPMWKVAPALLAGCTAVLKPSPLTPLTAALLVAVFTDAGVPDGVLNLVQGDRAAGVALVSHPDVAGISFTGSLPVGVAIQEAAAPRLQRTQLELGGKNAALVLADADLDKAVAAIVHGAFGQAGQRCSATSRVVVDRAVADELVARLVEKVSAMRVGPGTDPDTDIGPVVDETRLAACVAAVEQAQTEGAKVACGGSPVELAAGGWFMQPTVLRDVEAASTIAQEEIFGPVLSVITCDGYEDGMRITNGVRYGMSATLFTQDPARIFESLERFEAGMLHVNRPGVGAYAHLPHTGAKASQAGPPECSPQVWDFYTEWRSACITY